MLFLMDKIGGLLLAGLLGSKAPLTDDRNEARRARLFVTALMLGLLLGGLIYLLLSWKSLNWNPLCTDHTTEAWIALAGVPLAVIVITFVLESAKRRFK